MVALERLLFVAVAATMRPFGLRRKLAKLGAGAPGLVGNCSKKKPPDP